MSTPGTASRLTAEAAPRADATAAAAGQFPELLAGLVAASGAVEGDVRASASEGAPPPGLDTPAGIETLLGGTHTPQHPKAAPSTPAEPRTKEPEAGPDPELTAAGQAISAVTPQASLAALAAGPDPAVQKEIVSLSAGNGEATVMSAAPSPEQRSSAAPQPDGNLPAASEKILTVELPAELGLAEPGVTPGVANQEGQTATAAERNLPPPAESVPLSGRDGEPARQSAVPALGPGGPIPAAAVSAAGVKLAAAGEPAEPLPSWHAATRKSGQIPALEAEAPPDRAALDGEPASPPQAVGGAPQPSNGKELGQTAKAPALARSPVGIDAKPDAAAAGGGAVGRQHPRMTGVESVPPPLAAGKPAEAEAAQPALAPAPHSAPPARRRSQDPDVAVPAAETAVRAAIPTPLWRPSANTDPTDFSVRPSARTEASASPSRRSSGSAVAQVLALSGQASRTVDSIPPAEPSRQSVERAPGPWSNPLPSAGAEPGAAAEAPLQSLAETPVPAADTQVRVLTPSTPDRDEVAFAVQMEAMPAAEDTAQRAAPVKLPEAEGARQIPLAAPQHDVPAPEPAAGENRPSPACEADQAPARAGRERHPEAAPAERTQAPAGTHEGKLIPHAAPDAQVKAEPAPLRPDTAAAKPVRPQDAMDSETRPEAAKVPSVRDMKFEVTGGEQRVEVRVSERGGEVKMTVRTPDAQLAGTLRENLPTLSARLAESGFKSAAWHPAASSTDQWRHTAESSAGGASQDAHTPTHQQDRESQDDAGQRRPRSSQEATPQKEKGKDFAWLMSTLR